MAYQKGNIIEMMGFVYTWLLQVLQTHLPGIATAYKHKHFETHSTKMEGPRSYTSCWLLRGY